MFNVRALSMPLALVLTSGCLVDVEVEMSETCVSRTGVMIPGVMPGVSGDMQFSLGEDELADLPEEMITEATLTVHRVELVSAQDLSFVNGVALSFDGVELVSCTKDTCAGGGQIDLQAAMEETGEVMLGLRVDGELPQQDWLADVTVCFEAKAGFQI